MGEPASGLLFRDYLRAFKKAAGRWTRHYTVEALGNARHQPRAVPLLRLANARPQRGGLMLMAGFHGEEPAGPLMLLHNLHHILGSALDAGVPLSIYPVVNPYGFDNNLRTTVDGGYTNAGFIHDEDPTGAEVELLRRDMARFKPRVFLDLHEDDRESRTYLYAFGDKRLADELVHLMGRFIPHADGPLSHDGSLMAPGGQIRDHHDGSAEDFMSHQGTVASFASETPARFHLAVRLAVDLALVDHTLRHVAQLRRGKR